MASLGLSNAVVQRPVRATAGQAVVADTPVEIFSRCGDQVTTAQVTVAAIQAAVFVWLVEVTAAMSALKIYPPTEVVAMIETGFMRAISSGSRRLRAGTSRSQQAH